MCSARAIIQRASWTKAKINKLNSHAENEKFERQPLVIKEKTTLRKRICAHVEYRKSIMFE